MGGISANIGANDSVESVSAILHRRPTHRAHSYGTFGTFFFRGGGSTIGQQKDDNGMLVAQDLPCSKLASCQGFKLEATMK
jgi:hypothetical protein